MITVKKNFLLLLFQLTLMYTAKTQTHAKMEANINLNVIMVDHNIQQNLISRYGYGAQMAYFYNPFYEKGARNQFLMGFDIGYSFMGKYITSNQNNEEVLVKSRIIPFNVIARYRPLSGVFQPYIDLFGGIQYFSTKAQLNTAFLGFKKPIVGNTNDYSFAYGLGLGLSLHPESSDDAFL